ILRDRPRGTEYSRTEISYRVLDHADIEIVGWILALAAGFCGRSLVRVVIKPLRQALTGLMQESGGIFSRVSHLEFANIEGVHLRKVDAAPLLDAGKHRLALGVMYAFA